MSDALVFECDLKEEECTLVWSKDGENRKLECILQELDGPRRSRHNSAMVQKTKMAGGEFAGIKDFEGVDELLISLALMRKKNREFFTMAEVKEMKLPSRVTEQLTKKIRQMSGMDDGKEAAEDDAKND